MVWRARCSALLTDATVVSRQSATSAAGKAEDVAHDQHGALRRRQLLQRRDERQLDALAQLVARRRIGDSGLVGELRVGIRLEEHRLGHRRAEVVHRRSGRTVLDGEQAARSLGRQPVARVRGDPVQPRSQRAASLEAVQAAPRAEQRILERIVGVLDRPEHPVAVRVQVTAMRLHEATERIGVASTCRIQIGAELGLGLDASGATFHPRQPTDGARACLCDLDRCGAVAGATGLTDACLEAVHLSPVVVVGELSAVDRLQGLGAVDRLGRQLPVDRLHRLDRFGILDRVGRLDRFRALGVVEVVGDVVPRGSPDHGHQTLNERDHRGTARDELRLDPPSDG